ncbi:GNAT family N-acetyltransferase [Amnibacterium setariae]|uniref:GNAT family N-acetyltransferase n=1 Tax=Amnibacterium setariae TaxID=2306585 RepID=UPI001F35CEEA|nr:GNAT family N-acetyltransferase [Amnibacterium setariae]
MTPFAAVVDDRSGAAWNDLAELASGDAVALFATPPSRVPDRWRIEAHLECLQLVETPTLALALGGAADVVDLGLDDVPAMLELVEQTHPGPFLEHTVDLGGYIGVRDELGRLVAMAGRRLATGGWREISAVCTSPAHRGRGLARRLVAIAAARIKDEGERPFLHVTAGNPAIALYDAMGFELRSTIDVVVVRHGE